MSVFEDGSGFNDDDAVGYNRPRRPKPETVTYLLGLPLDTRVAKTELKAFATGAKTDDDQNEVDFDFPPSVAASLSAIDEIRHEIASLAGDESGSQCLEVLAHIAAPVSEKAARILLHSCAGYHLHLATHRYASHVIQTLLELAVQKSQILVEHSPSHGDLSEHEESPPVFQDLNFEGDSDSDKYTSVPPLGSLLQDMLEELTPHASTLSMHVCGSHVLRTLLCVLGGVRLEASGAPGVSSEVTTSMRGRPKKKKKKRKPDATPKKEPHAGTMRIVYRPKNMERFDEETKQEMQEVLHSLSKAIVGKDFMSSSVTPEPGELQDLACHQSAGPLLIIMLRVLTYSGESDEEKSDTTESNSTPPSGDFRLGIDPPEPTFKVNSPAHQLVKHLICWQDGVTPQPHVGDIIYNFSGEARGSHVLEALLRVAPDVTHDAIIQYGEFLNPKSMTDYVAHDVGNRVVQTLLQTVRSKESAEKIVQMMGTSILSNGYVMNTANHRRGIMWRTVELAAKYRVGQEGILKALRIGFGATAEASKDEEPNEPLESTGAGDGKKQRKKKRKKESAVDIRSCIPMLLRVKLPLEDKGGRLGLDAAGARTVYHLLRFVPRLCEDVLKSIIEDLSAEELFAIAKDGLGSRCIMDGILDGPHNSTVFGDSTKKLRDALAGRWVALAIDRVGHHTVKKLFNALPRIKDKSKLVEELATEGGNRLSGTSMGRSVMEACAVEEYLHDKKAWRQHVSKMITGDGEKWIEKELSSKNKDKKAGESKEVKEKSKRKRKRKKRDQEDGNEPPAKMSAVDSIMRIMSTPGGS